MATSVSHPWGSPRGRGAAKHPVSTSAPVVTPGGRMGARGQGGAQDRRQRSRSSACGGCGDLRHIRVGRTLSAAAPLLKCEILLLQCIELGQPKILVG